MSDDSNAPHVGAQDPTLKNSPIADEIDNIEREPGTLKQQVPGEPVCFFNGESYPHGAYVSSGTGLLRCDYGIWVRAGSSDPDNP